MLRDKIDFKCSDKIRWLTKTKLLFKCAYLFKASQELSCIHGRISRQNIQRMTRQLGGQPYQARFPAGSSPDLYSEKKQKSNHHHTMLVHQSTESADGCDAFSFLKKKKIHPSRPFGPLCPNNFSYAYNSFFC